MIILLRLSTVVEVWREIMRGMPHEECTGYFLKTRTLHRLWWTGRMLLGYHPLQHGGRDLVTSPKAITGTQHHHPKLWSHYTKPRMWECRTWSVWVWPRKYLCGYLINKNNILQVKSNHAEYKHVSLRIVVIPGKDEIFEVSINGRTDTTPIKSDFNIICNMW